MGGHFKNFEFDGNQQFQISGHPTKMETLCIKVAKPPKSGVCLFLWFILFSLTNKAEQNGKTLAKKPRLLLVMTAILLSPLLCQR